MVSLSGSGGAVLQSDILGKKLEFFKNLGEHVQQIGQKVIANNTMTNASGIVNLFEVPDRKTLYLWMLSYDFSNATAGINTFFSIGLGASGSSLEEVWIRKRSIQGEGDIHNDIVLSPMLRVDSGLRINMQQTTGAVNTEFTVNLIGFLIEKEISLQ